MKLCLPLVCLFLGGFASPLDLQETEYDAQIGESISLNDDPAEVKNDTTATDDDFTRVFTHNNQDETILQDVERFSLDFDLPQENETAPGPWLNQTSDDYDWSIFENLEDNLLSGRDINSAKGRGSPCCHRIIVEAMEIKHGVRYVHYDKLGVYTITNTLVGGRNTWVSIQNTDLVITWCGSFWHIGHKENAGECTGFISTPNDVICVERAINYRYYAKCINEWVDATPSRLRIRCVDNTRRIENIGGNDEILDIDPRHNKVSTA